MGFSFVNQKIITDEHKRKILLGSSLIIIYFLVDVFFFIVNLFNPEGIPWILLSGALASVACLIILRSGKIEIALFLFLVRSNGLVYFFSYLEDINTGTYLYFISNALTPVAFFGYKERWKGLGYSFITFCLFLYAELKPDQFSPDSAHFYFITNFSIVIFTAGFIFLFFDRINKEAGQMILEKNKELEKTNEELDRFVYHASHDLRAPLTSILGLTNIYKLATTEEEKQKIVNMISDRVGKLDHFINDVLTYSQNSRMDLSKEQVMLRSLIDECIDFLKYNPHFENIQFKIEVDPTAFIYTDSRRLKAILTNLISNSIKYSDDLKEQSFIAIRVSAKKNETTISIEDNGIGIPHEHLAKIFDMFFRAHTQSEGSGLGLYIANECVTKISGKMNVQSEVGKGSVFEVSIPVQI